MSQYAAWLKLCVKFVVNGSLMFNTAVMIYFLVSLIYSAADKSKSERLALKPVDNVTPVKQKRKHGRVIMHSDDDDDNNSQDSGSDNAEKSPPRKRKRLSPEATAPVSSQTSVAASPLVCDTPKVSPTLSCYNSS